MSSRATQPETDDLAAELDKIFEKEFAVLRKRILTAVARRERRLLKQASAVSRTSRAPTAPRKREKAPVEPSAPTKRAPRKKYHSSSSESESD